MNVPFITGIIAGAFTSVSMFPQIIKIIKEKKAKDVSLWMPFVLFVGHALWITYGVMQKDIPIIIPNCIAIILDVLLIALTLKFGTQSNVETAPRFR